MSSAQLTTPHAVRVRAGARRAEPVRADDDTPWVSADRLLTTALIVMGTGLILAAWIGASGTTQWDTQVRWTALSIVGVMVVCVGVGSWLFQGFLRVRIEARAVRRALGDRLARPAARTGTPGGAVERVTAKGMAHHHRPDCLLVAGKDVHPAGVEGLRPCGVCG